MAGPGPLDDWSAWHAPTRPIRPAPARGQPRSQAPSPWEAARSTGRQPVWDAASAQGRQEVAGNSLGASNAPTVPMQPLPGRWQAPPVPLTPTRRGRGARWKRVVGLTLVALVLLLAIFGGLGARRLYAFGQAISPQSPLSSQTGFMSGSQRVNVVVLGYGGSGHDGAYLTDSLMVISLVPSTGATTLISVPRDLWVQVPPDSGQYGKLNTAYQTGLDNGYGNLPAGKLAGGALAARKVSDVTGLNVQYWVTIDFTGFRKLVDALGGVEINVPTAFTANYPINDDPQINAGWKTIHFNAGPQHMTGEQAIEYARARYVTDPVSEGTDFARSARQQLLIRAMLARARQVSAWPGLANAADALQGALYTNLSLADLGLFGQKMSLNNAHRVGLSNQNVLMDAQSSDGQSILLPQNDDWTAVQSYVSQHLAP